MQEAILEVLEVDWRKRNEIDFMVGKQSGAVCVATSAVCQGNVGVSR